MEVVINGKKTKPAAVIYRSWWLGNRDRHCFIMAIKQKKTCLCRQVMGIRHSA